MIYGQTCEVCGAVALTYFDDHVYCDRHLSPEAKAWAIDTVNGTLAALERGDLAWQS